MYQKDKPNEKAFGDCPAKICVIMEADMGFKHRRIGLLVSGIMDPFTKALCRGVAEICRNNYLDLIVFPGKYLDRDLSGQPEIMYEYQFNTLFRYAKSKTIDGLIVSAGSIGSFAGEARVRKMLEAFGDIPYIIVASKWDGAISINYDNKSGVREGLEYLISEMHCMSFAMLGGPLGNNDAKEREMVFREVMEEHGIIVSERMVIRGDLNRYNIEACNKLLDDNPDVQAIFCANDEMALGLYEVMRKRGLVPGEDIKIMGFDNSVEGAKAKPSLSSVNADAGYLGQRAVQKMLGIFEGEKVEPELLPTCFIKRDSFGDSDTGEEIKGNLSKEEVERFFEDIFYRYLNQENMDDESVREKFHLIVDHLVAYAHNPVLNAEAEQRLIKDIDFLMDRNALDYADMDKLLFYVGHLFDVVCAGISDKENHSLIRSLENMIYKKIILAMDHRFGYMLYERQEDINAMKILVRDSLKFRTGNDSAYAALLECAGWMDIQNAFLYVFKEPIPHLYMEEFIPPEFMYLKAFLKNGQINAVPVNKQKIETEYIFFNRYTEKERNDYVVLPLFYNEMQYGLFLCDLTDKVYMNGEFLTNQLGAAVRMIELLRDNEQIQLRLNELVASLRKNNIALDHLSKQDALTGSYNRRGFMEEAKRLLGINISRHKDTLVAYVDMNNLKVINDRYGHEEGDYSLKMISQVLNELVKESGLVGRIGGDEFAFVMTMDSGLDGVSLERRIHSMFAAYNQKIDKPFNVTVSVGLYKIKFENPIKLEEGLSYADERLYIAKKNKVRTVEKVFGGESEGCI